MQNSLYPHAQDKPQKTLLVLENDEYLAGLMQFLLTREGYSIQTISDPGMAILHIENAPPADLIFMDQEWLHLPEASILPILRNYPGWHAVPIISLMHHFDESEIERQIHAGITDYLIQPFEPQTLLDQIKRYTVDLVH